MSESSFTNRLVHETSPYLRQHAHNPVDWYPWGEEALALARRLDQPIFLSVGYSACHWCHVMEHESFEDSETARLLNEHFVCIKVDREERPDLDAIYMLSVQLMTGQGGWPMSVFLTPDLRPFTGGTYFPPDDRYGRPGFKRILLHIANLWRNDRARINEAAQHLTDHLQLIERVQAGDQALEVELLRRASQGLSQVFDPQDGGFGQPPKFLHTMDLRLLLRNAQRFDDPDARHIVTHTLTRMAMGGICDHLGGGFARYSTDARWLVPHFEKMLYDNALLVQVYLEAFQLTGDPHFREVVSETLGWVAREMTSPEGPFYSTLDADSEGVEGKFYVWSDEEIRSILGTDAADFSRVYNVERRGNWEGHNILHRTRNWEQLAKHLSTTEAALRERMAACRRKLFEARAKRVRPGRDEKMLTSWNGLMIGALAEAAQVFDEPAHAAAAAKAADFILTRLRTTDGRLLRTFSSGSEPKLNAYLEDYSFLLDGLVSLYEATFEPRWIEEAVRLGDKMIEQFWDEAEGGFFFTGRDHEQLIARTKDPHDNATPSSAAVAVTALLRLAKLTGRSDWQHRAEQSLRLYSGEMAKHSRACAQLLLALDFLLGPAQEFAVVGDPESSETRQVLRLLRQGFRPRKVVAFKPPSGAPRLDTLLPLLAGKTAHAGVRLYICRDFVCQMPLDSVAAVEAALQPPGQ